MPCQNGGKCFYFYQTKQIWTSNLAAILALSSDIVWSLGGIQDIILACMEMCFCVKSTSYSTLSHSWQYCFGKHLGSQFKSWKIIIRWPSWLPNLYCVNRFRVKITLVNFLNNENRSRLHSNCRFASCTDRAIHVLRKFQNGGRTETMLSRSFRLSRRVTQKTHRRFSGLLQQVRHCYYFSTAQWIYILKYL